MRKPRLEDWALLAAVVFLPAIASAAEPPDGKPFSVQQHLDWKIAICYHPMYMLVDEDRTVPTVGERIPPGGQPRPSNTWSGSNATWTPWNAIRS